MKGWLSNMLHIRNLLSRIFPTDESSYLSRMNLVRIIFRFPAVQLPGISKKPRRMQVHCWEDPFQPHLAHLKTLYGLLSDVEVGACRLRSSGAPLRRRFCCQYACTASRSSFRAGHATSSAISASACDMWSMAATAAALARSVTAAPVTEACRALGSCRLHEVRVWVFISLLYQEFVRCQVGIYALKNCVTNEVFIPCIDRKFVR